ncbi:hypothetical protein GT347_17390 [Xylophilus rhododendri]|uniref:Uncharacterized protein n=1 Tax=Xylophilus rhododendri TaxID=2697032 RepID=A0A857J6G7_9BURK|nr:hypothetical protein [Xylophilus rhododendri]QHI99590.1 hypothetical protein GT347_17390 [Xylophilus rhododendri]
MFSSHFHQFLSNLSQCLGRKAPQPQAAPGPQPPGLPAATGGIGKTLQEAVPKIAADAASFSQPDPQQAPLPASSAADRLHDLAGALVSAEHASTACLQQLFAKSDLSTLLGILPPAALLDVLTFAFDPAFECPEGRAFDSLKNWMLETSGHDGRLVGQVLKQAVWRKALQHLPVSDAAMAQRVDAIQSQLDASGDYQAYLAANLEIVRELREKSGAAGSAAEPQALFLNNDIEKWRAALLDGSIDSPEKLTAVLLDAVDRNYAVRLARLYPGAAMKIGKYGLGGVKHGYVSSTELSEFTQENLQATLAAAHTAMLEMLNDPAFAPSAGGPEIGGILSDGLLLLQNILEIPQRHQANDYVLREIAQTQPSTPEHIGEILEQSMMQRQVTLKKFGHTSVEERTSVDFFWTALKLLRKPASKMALGKAIQDLIIQFKQVQAQAIGKRQQLPPDGIEALLDNTVSHVRHYYDFMAQAADPFATPAGMAPFSETDAPYRQAVEDLENGTRIADPKDPRFVSASDFLLRSHALLEVNRAERAARIAGTPFDRAAFIDSSTNADVAAAAPYLQASFSRWPA